MAEKLFLNEVYRYYFEYDGSQYLFVVLSNHGAMIGRLYNKHGMIPDFEVNVDDSVHAGLSSYSPKNPFEAAISIAKNHVEKVAGKKK